MDEEDTRHESKHDDWMHRKTKIFKWFQIIKKLLMNITVEPLLFLHGLGYGLAAITIPSLYFDKICLVMYVS